MGKKGWQMWWRYKFELLYLMVNWNLSRNKTRFFFFFSSNDFWLQVDFGNLYQLAFCSLVFCVTSLSFSKFKIFCMFGLDISLYKHQISKYCFIIQSGIFLFSGVFSHFIFNVIIIYLNLNILTILFALPVLFLFVSLLSFGLDICNFIALFPISLLFLHNFTLFC